MFAATKKVIKRNLTKEAVKAHLILFTSFYTRFGLWTGAKLFVKFKLRKLDRIQLPGYPYTFSLRPDTSDIKAFNQIFLDVNYHFRYVDKPKVIIDAGANIGLFSIRMKKEYPEAGIICLEPDKDNFQKLTTNLSGYNNIHLENCALWGNDSRGKAMDKFNLGSWGMVVEEDKIEGSFPCITIPYLLEKYSLNEIDILKMDIETSEKQVFLAPNIEWLQKVKVLIIELHDWLEPGCASGFFKAINSTFSDYIYLIRGEYTVIINTQCYSELNNRTQG